METAPATTFRIRTDDDAFEAENAEAEAIAVRAMNAHRASGGRFGQVSWKDEGRYGPVFVEVWSEPTGDGRRSTVRPFGDACPTCGYFEAMHSRSKSDEGTFYLGWMSRTEAKRLAKWAGVALTDY